MKKSDIAGFVIYILMFAIAITIGIFVIRTLFNPSPFGGGAFMPYLWTLLIILSALVVNSFGLELLHLLGGKLGGYNIVAFNVFGLCFYKALGKWKFGFKSFDGLTGETVLAPKSEKSKPHAYVWFPILGYLIELIAGIVIFTIFKGKSSESWKAIVALFAIIYITVSSMIALYNFFPARLDSMTDGYRLTLITKPVNVEAYNELMRIENLQREGKEVGSIKVFEEITEFTTAINLMSVYEKLGKHELIEAEKMIDKIIEFPEKISSTTYNRLIAQKLYIKIMTLPKAEAQKYYDENVDDKIRRFISNDTSMESIRAYVLIAGILDESSAEVSYANASKAKAMKKTLPARAKVEEELYAEAIAFVKKAHKTWEIE